VTLWNAILDGLGGLLEFFSTTYAGLPVLGAWAWAWAIVTLTVVVRVALLPLAVKQINSMRAMQQLQPEVKKIQKKYKADRDLMRKNPEKYRAQRQKQQEELMSLYKEHKVNPAAGCLPLLLQLPVFFALFRLLYDEQRVPELADAGFFLVESLTSTALQAGVAGVGAWMLVVLMGASTYFSQRQMMANNPAAADQPHMKIMLYVMPVMLTVFAANFPIGVLLYWVTTNLWTIAQQWVMFRNVQQTKPAAA
jgi:YidC/Oxa1 family membrane protein insertase